MSGLEWRVVPIDRWPGEETRQRKDHPFRVVTERWNSFRGETVKESRSGVDWSATVGLLEKELGELRAKNILLQMAVTEKDIRNDGWIRANACPDHPGVILTFDSKHGPLSYPCDTFRDWQANVRAIALSLEALRKVDRYGVTKRGEQYTGFGRLPPAGGSTSTMTAEVAARVIADAAGGESTTLLRSAGHFRNSYRTAARRTHPDSGGSVRDFQLVQEAKGVLERHHGLAGARP